MEKYRRFTDEKAGINPFIKPVQFPGFFIKLLRPFIFLIKLAILLFGIVIRSVTFIPEIILPNPIYKVWNSMINTYFCSIFFLLSGLIQKDIFALTKHLAKHPEPKVILINNSCSLDGFIALCYFSPVQFAVKNKTKNVYSFASRSSLLFRFFSNTGFITDDERGVSLKELNESARKNGRSLVLFFENVRTIGDGVLESQEVVEDLMSLQSVITTVALQYKISNPSVKTVTNSPFINLFNILTTQKISLKVKINRIQTENQQRFSEMFASVYDFYNAYGFKRINKGISDYQEFLRFYHEHKSK